MTEEAAGRRRETQATAFWRLEVFESISSTSDFCRSRALEAEPEGLAVVAGWQTAGRGSRGREWLSERGNLFLSVLLRPDDDARYAGYWALLAAVAVAEALARGDVALKWPNDILQDGKKLGGILIDTQADSIGRIEFMVIGIGLNLRASPVIEGRDVTALANPPAPEALACKILDRLADWRQRYDRQAVREAWLRHAMPVGTAMTLRLAHRQISGNFAGLADDASLLLDTGGAVQKYSSGEIWLTDKMREHMPC